MNTPYVPGGQQPLAEELAAPSGEPIAVHQTNAVSPAERTLDVIKNILLIVALLGLLIVTVKGYFVLEHAMQAVDDLHSQIADAGN